MNPDQTPADARIETLEIKLAHLERALQELSDAVYSQQQRLDGHDARYQQLLDRAATAPEPGVSATDEVPPHY